jgi:hypothetical protein
MYFSISNKDIITVILFSCFDWGKTTLKGHQIRYGNLINQLNSPGAEAS